MAIIYGTALMIICQYGTIHVNTAITAMHKARDLDAMQGMPPSCWLENTIKGSPQSP